MAPPGSDDQHSTPRAVLRLRVDYERMNSFFADYTKNLSQGGTFIKTPRPLPVGTRCQFNFSLPALPDPLVIEGEVTRQLLPEAAKEQGGEAGMGVKFLFSDAAAQRQFGELVEKLMSDSLGPEATRALLGG